MFSIYLSSKRLGKIWYNNAHQKKNDRIISAEYKIYGFPFYCSIGINFIKNVWPGFYLAKYLVWKSIIVSEPTKLMSSSVCGKLQGLFFIKMIIVKIILALKYINAYNNNNFFYFYIKSTVYFYMKMNNINKNGMAKIIKLFIL